MAWPRRARASRGQRPVATTTVMNVVDEGQPALADELVQAGAVVRLDIVHLERALPRRSA
jgi:hypothetical protein